MNVDNGSWSKRAVGQSDSMSNFALNSNLRPEFLDYNNPDYEVKECNTGSQSTAIAYVKTKRFDFGSPEQQKRISKIHLVYKSSATVQVTIGIDGSDSTSILTFSTQSEIDVESQPVSVLAKTVHFLIKSTSADFILESMDVDYQILGSNP